MTQNRKGKSAPLFSNFSKVKSEDSSPGNVPVYLNVYDLTPMNGYVYWLGLGVYHSGVQVHGVEYAYGAHEHQTSGIFMIEPRKCPGFSFRESIFIGMTKLDATEVQEFMDRQSVNYIGDSYHLVVKNCNHFSADACNKLTGNQIPKWVNRLAKIGLLCNRILPAELRTPPVTENIRDYVSEEKKVGSYFSCFSSISMDHMEHEVSISSLYLHSHYKLKAATKQP